MKTYELFGTQVEISEEDEARLGKCLRSWNSLHESFSVENFSEKDLMRLIVLETLNSKRPYILRRIHSRLVSIRRERDKKELGL